jgi:hypothetical protein
VDDNCATNDNDCDTEPATDCSADGPGQHICTCTVSSGTWGDGVGTDGCQDCPANSAITGGNTAITGCECTVGYTVDAASRDVTTEKRVCTIVDCPDNATGDVAAAAAAGTVSATDTCVCNAGYFGDAGWNDGSNAFAPCQACTAVDNTVDDTAVTSLTCSECLACSRVASNSCKAGYHYVAGTAGASGTADTCVLNICTCVGGIEAGGAADAAACPTHDAAKCASCNAGNFQDGDACPACATACVVGQFESAACAPTEDPAAGIPAAPAQNRACEACTAVDNAKGSDTTDNAADDATLTCTSADDSAITACMDGYNKVAAEDNSASTADTCPANVCTCPNGTERAEPDCTAQSGVECASCGNGARSADRPLYPYETGMLCPEVFIEAWPVV